MFHCQYYNLRVRCYECKNKKTCKICPRSIKLPQPRFTKPEFELSGLDQLMDYKIEVSSENPSTVLLRPDRQRTRRSDGPLAQCARVKKSRF